MISIKLIEQDQAKDIRLPNQPFSLFGQMVPTYQNQTWTYQAIYREPSQVEEMCFPDEAYDFEKMKENSTFIGAYDGDLCIGLAVLQEAWFSYMYLYDFKVNQAFRGKGVAKLLIEKAKQVAKDKGYKGLYTQGQDNNLGACLFYVKAGFTIGGLDTQVYKGTAQEGKVDIIFYLDFE